MPSAGSFQNPPGPRLEFLPVARPSCARAAFVEEAPSVRRHDVTRVEAQWAGRRGSEMSLPEAAIGAYERRLPEGVEERGQSGHERSLPADKYRPAGARRLAFRLTPRLGVIVAGSGNVPAIGRGQVMARLAFSAARDELRQRIVRWQHREHARDAGCKRRRTMA